MQSFARSFDLEDHISLSATVDNITIQNRAAMLIASLLTYINLLYMFSSLYLFA
jgi:hypothetical protein